MCVCDMRTHAQSFSFVPTHLEFQWFREQGGGSLRFVAVKSAQFRDHLRPGETQRLQFLDRRFREWIVGIDGRLYGGWSTSGRGIRLVAATLSVWKVTRLFQHTLLLRLRSAVEIKR